MKHMVLYPDVLLNSAIMLLLEVVECDCISICFSNRPIKLLALCEVPNNGKKKDSLAL